MSSEEQNMDPNTESTEGSPIVATQESAALDGAKTSSDVLEGPIETTTAEVANKDTDPGVASKEDDKGDGNAAGSEAAKPSADPNKPKMGDVYTALLESVYNRWYDIFLHLGVDRARLDKIEREHPSNAHLCMLDIIAVWLEQENPPPTWQALADVLRNKLLEGRVADEIEEKFCGGPPKASMEDERARKQLEEDLTARIDDDSMEYSKILIDMTEALGPDSYAQLHHYLSELRCPDGSRLIDIETMRERRTPDGLLIPLVYNNLCCCRDVDMLIHIAHAMNREDLLPMIQEYIPKVTVGTPNSRVVFENKDFFILKGFLNPAIKHVDLSIASVLKHAVCTIFEIQDKPYLMQFVGWEDNPIALQFQFPLACLPMVEENISDVSCMREFVSNGIEKLELNIHTSKFEYDLLTQLSSEESGTVATAEDNAV